MILTYCTYVVLIILAVLFFVALYRVVAGPAMPDRMLALDLMGANVIGLIIVYTIMNDQPFFLDVVLLLAMLGFLASVAFAYYLEKKGRP